MRLVSHTGGQSASIVKSWVVVSKRHEPTEKLTELDAASSAELSGRAYHLKP
jgi:hypothetical protein